MVGSEYKMAAFAKFYGNSGADVPLELVRSTHDQIIDGPSCPEICKPTFELSSDEASQLVLGSALVFAEVP